jgi:glycine dehydrogenase subunit 1
MPFIPHTKDEVEAMQSYLRIPNVDTLFDEIPASLRASEFHCIPDGMNEMTLQRHAETLAKTNQLGLCFLGAGSYEHHIPAAVWEIASRGEFLTAYTPYQAEASQGTLQLLYEFQTLIAELTGMDVANASLYDGASALAEAVLMAVRLNRHSKATRILVPESLHPLYRDTLTTIVSNQHIELISLPVDEQTGTTSLHALQRYQEEDITALVIPQPNFFGCLEDVDALSDWAHAKNVISIACVNPVSLGLLKPPSLWGQHGVDIVCGEGQPFGAPMASGGPYVGFFSTRLAHVRQMPGRLIGRTIDKDGKTGYTLTLQAREQHIRRGKATSNICTNQGLLVTTATIHMSLLGPDGLAQIAQACHENTYTLVQALTNIPGVSLKYQSPYFHEALLTLPCKASTILDALHEKGITGGLDASRYYPTCQNTILVCATEKRTEEDIEYYANMLRACLQQEGHSC